MYILAINISIHQLHIIAYTQSIASGPTSATNATYSRLLILRVWQYCWLLSYIYWLQQKDTRWSYHGNCLRVQKSCITWYGESPTSHYLQTFIHRRWTLDFFHQQHWSPWPWVSLHCPSLPKPMSVCALIFDSYTEKNDGGYTVCCYVMSQNLGPKLMSIKLSHFPLAEWDFIVLRYT